MDAVIKLISPKKLFVPILYNIAKPMLVIKTNGSKNDSVNKMRTKAASKAPIPTYSGFCFAITSLLSIIAEAIPLTNTWCRVILFISLIACVVPTSEMSVSRKAAITVLFPELNILYVFLGKNSLGMLTSTTSSYQITLLTCFTFLIFSLSSNNCLSFIPSKIKKTNAPLPNSFFKTFAPLTVSKSLGK